MTDKNQERDNLRSRGSEDDALDHELDAALSQYAAVEPRSGLEERILANLQAERAQIPERAWWRWVAATVAVVIIIAVALMWKSGRPTQQQIVQHPAIEQSLKKSPPQVAANDEHSGVRNVITPTRRAGVHHLQRVADAVATVNPKLDIFPSPQPMSEQERLLAAYIAQSPERAALVAEARMESLRRDEQEMHQGPGADNDSESVQKIR
jgi:hypothetical protein